MRRRPIAAVFLVLAVSGWLAAGDAKHQYVRIREVRLKEAPGFTAKVVEPPLGYGARVGVVRKEGMWYEVRLEDGKSGWLHQCALDAKKIVLKSGDADVARGASADEVTLAGKGFSAEVEKRHREENPKLDYGAVDRVGGYRVTSEEMSRFLKEGGLQIR